MKGLDLCARYSYITNKLGYCGPEKSHKLFYDYVTEKKNEKEVIAALKRFEGLYPYLELIAKKNKKKPFDYDVVEAYWIGNKLLKNITKNDLKLLIKKLTTRGLPKSLGKKLIDKMPDDFVPHHSFNVFYVGVGSITRSVKTTLSNMDKCRISWGKVRKITGNKAVVEREKLFAEGKMLYLKSATSTFPYDKKFTPRLNKHDNVALHWGFAADKISNKQLRNLRKYTIRNMNAFNSYLASAKP
ncbi:hypothetical protein KY339_01795 [Candidatus Woesearchaeota archaeon]|nr:hypothetical protein [Candidatus Woesearchaeota archaeon]